MPGSGGAQCGGSGSMPHAVGGLVETAARIAVFLDFFLGIRQYFSLN